ncbi:MAG TPA: glycosyltransferase family 39 protein [Rhizomicrobium sp.]|nr:glycosyltransferase family 39 protein [Rhizomicrobium sp.]
MRVAVRQSLWLCGFVLLAFALRYGSLTREVINADESTFMVMAQDVLRGHLPYVRLFDNKPPGIFLAVAGIMALFGQSLAVVRLSGGACLVVAASINFAICKRLTDEMSAGFASLAMIAAASNHLGLHTSAELPIVMFLMAALWLMIARSERLWAAFLAGICLSLATLLKTNVAPVVIMAGLLYLAGAFRPALRFHRFAIVAYVIGGLIPLGAVQALYAQDGHLALFFLSAVTVPLSYATTQMPLYEVAWMMFAKLISETFSLPGSFGCFVVLCGLGFAAIIPRLKLERDFLIYGAMFLACVIAVLICGIFYEHYFLLLIVPGGIAVAFALQPTQRWRLPAHIFAYLAIVLGLAAAAPSTFAMLADAPSIEAHYPVKNAADAITADKTPNDAVWAVADNLVYFYMHILPPSPLALSPENILRPSIEGPLARAGYVSPDEFGRLIRLVPRYIVTSSKTKIPLYMKGEDRARFAALLGTRYTTWRVDGPVTVYKRR